MALADEQPAPASRSRRGFLIAVGAGLVLIALALLLGGPTTKVVVTLVVVTTLLGAWRGALETGAFVVALIVATLIAFPLGRALEDQIGAALGLSGLDKRGASIAVVALAVLMASSVLTGMLAKRLKKKWPTVAKADRPVGATLGFLEGVLLTFLVLWGAFAIQASAQQRVDQNAAARQAGAGPSENSLSERLARGVLAFATDATTHRIGSIAAKRNPIAELQAVTLAEDYLDIANNPEAMRVFQESDAIRRIQEHPGFQRALEALRSDPQVQAALDRGLDPQGLAAIRKSDAVLDIIDDPDLLREVEVFADELRAALDEAKARIRDE